MSVVVRVKVHRAGVRRMLGQPYMVREVAERVRRVAAYGRLRSPYVTGHYSRSWFWRAGTRNGIAYGKAGNRASYAWFLERGTRNRDGTPRISARHYVKEALRAAAD